MHTRDIAPVRRVGIVPDRDLLSLRSQTEQKSPVLAARLESLGFNQPTRRYAYYAVQTGPQMQGLLVATLALLADVAVHVLESLRAGGSGPPLTVYLVTVSEPDRMAG